ncbi:MAG: exopolysaccharide biosynthesis polyprenyl glycosylphosphotransferase [Vicingaceae bacterium]|nr:exopolysaccharide biosynthesis polyprenyl glycosylphosphotransferase [Vicingaceae bacterium]
MDKNHKYFLGLYYRFIDLITLNVAFFIAEFLRFREVEEHSFLESKYLTLLIVINLSWVVLSHSQKIYSTYLFASRRRYFLRVLLVVLLQLLITIGLNGLIKTFYSRLFLLYTFIGFAVLMTVGRLLTNLVYKAYIAKRIKKNLVVIVGKGFSISDVKSSLLESIIDDDYQQIEEISDTQNLIKKLEELRSSTPITELYIKISLIDESLMEDLSNYCDNNFIRLRLVLDWQRVSSKVIEARNISHTTVLNIPLTPLDDPYNTLLKRSFDVLFSSFIMIAVLSWLFPILAIIIKFTSKGPVFFKQKRTGLGNKEFNCWKFRSMTVNKDSDKVQATKGDKRITKVGHFLRRSSLDEFPQFINVFLGDMSVVGPRPHMLKHTEEYSQLIGNFMNRHAIKPGITGLAQVKGYRGEIDDSYLLTNRVRLDRFYVNNWSLYLDMKIVFYTMFGMFKDHK